MSDEVVSSQIPPRGLTPSEVASLREETGLEAAAFGDLFGVSSNIVERWEGIGVPSGPIALALRLVAREMGFEFPQISALGGEACTICGGPAAERVHGLPVCTSCHREPVANMEAVGFRVTRTEHLSGDETLHVQVPAGSPIPVAGRFMSEGLGTMLTKMFKDEPQIGNADWDDAVYVHWVEPGLEALDDDGARDILRSLVAYGIVDIARDGIDVQHVPNWGPFDDEIILLSGILANRLSA